MFDWKQAKAELFNIFGARKPPSLISRRAEPQLEPRRSCFLIQLAPTSPYLRGLRRFLDSFSVDGVRRPDFQAIVGIASDGVGRDRPRLLDDPVHRSLPCLSQSSMIPVRWRRVFPRRPAAAIAQPQIIFEGRSDAARKTLARHAHMLSETGSTIDRHAFRHAGDREGGGVWSRRRVRALKGTTRTVFAGRDRCGGAQVRNALKCRNGYRHAGAVAVDRFHTWVVVAIVVNGYRRLEVTLAGNVAGRQANPSAFAYYVGLAAALLAAPCLAHDFRLANDNLAQEIFFISLSSISSPPPRPRSLNLWTLCSFGFHGPALAVNTRHQFYHQELIGARAR